MAGLSSGYSAVPSTSFWLAAGHASLSVMGLADGLVPDADNPCAALVTASGKADLAGTLTLKANDGAVMTPTTIQVQVAAGRSESFAFALRLAGRPAPLTGPFSVSLSAVLAPAAGDAVVAEAAVPIQDRPLTGVPLVQAEAFAEQAGGEVRIRDDKPGSSGKAFSHWDNKGHTLTWRIEVPAAGRYHLVIRYACGTESLRSLLVDGQALPGAEQILFPVSGGLSGAAGDWAHLAVRDKDGRFVVLDLTAGTHKLTMVNVNARPLNLDYLALVPVP